MRILTAFLLVCSAAICVAAPKGTSEAPLMSLGSITPDDLSFQSADDGTKFIAIRLKNENAQAVRVHITNMRLAEDQQLFISSPTEDQVQGPFQGSGPLQTGEFWSLPISGSDIVVEFQVSKGELPADLPFILEDLEATTMPDPVEAVPENSDDAALFEGDIMVGAHQFAMGSKKGDHSAVGIVQTRNLWPNGTIPYIISPAIPNPSRVTVAINQWNTTMAGTVHLVPRTTETTYLNFVATGSTGTCSSYVGMITYGPQPVYVGTYCNGGSMVHEIGHAFGLWHEHTRKDRDGFVKINWDNIQGGTSYNFDQVTNEGKDIGLYDYSSIMHYPGNAFSVNGKPTIETIPAGIPIGQRSILSAGDIAAIKSLYSSSNPQPPVTVPITITSNPTGLLLAVDGNPVVTPARYDWTPGSTHTVNATNSTAATAKYTFVSWSDGGSSSHTITTPTTATQFKADFAVAHSVKTKASTGGVAYVTPPAADAFYAAGSIVTAGTMPMSGYCFGNWTGLIPGTPDRATLTIDKAYDLQANFIRGSITLSATVLFPPATATDYTVGVTANSGCTWGVFSTQPWVTITSGQTGSGSGVVKLAIAPNPTTVARTAQINIGYKTMVISQAGKR